MCSHIHNVETNYYTVICTACGAERNFGPHPEPVYSQNMALNRSYSRPERWKTLIYKLTGFHNGPNVADPVWAYLEKHKPFPGPQHILTALRSSGLRNKHYQSIFIFTKVFAPDFVLPTAEQSKLTNTLLKKYFESVFSLWNRYRKGAPFFSYNWLIEQGIHYVGHTEFLPFLKKLLCKRRRQRYCSALSKLYETHAGTRNREQPDIRFPSVIVQTGSPRNLYGPPAYPLPSQRGLCKLGLPPGLVYTLLRLRDAAQKR